QEVDAGIIHAGPDGIERAAAPRLRLLWRTGRRRIRLPDTLGGGRVPDPGGHAFRGGDGDDLLGVHADPFTGTRVQPIERVSLLVVVNHRQRDRVEDSIEGGPGVLAARV